MSAIQKFISFYSQLNQRKLSELQAIYTQDVLFIDPVSRHQGLLALTGYFSALMENTGNCSFEIHTTVSNGETTFITWQMTFQHRKLKGGEAITVDGVSELTVAGDKIRFQRDYYDMGEMIYENVPLLGALVKAIKGRLAN